MKHLICRKISIIAGSLVASLAVVAASFYGLLTGAAKIHEHFLVGTLLVAASPVVLFALSYLYQYGVVNPLRQIITLPFHNVTRVQKALLESAREAFQIGRWVPIALTILAIISGLILVPNIIGREALISVEFINKVIASAVIAANLIFAVELANLVRLRGKRIIKL